MLGLVLWLVLREDETKREYAKVCGIAAIAGAVIVGVGAILLAVMKLAGMELFTTVPLDGMAAFVLNLIR